MINYSDFDKECINICKAINRLNGIKTIESCCGHGNSPFRVWMIIDNLDELPILLYFLDICHVGFNWDCLATTDCAMSPVKFRIESRSIGKQAYKEAEIVAKEINKYLDDYNE